MNNAICLMPVIPMRADAVHKSEQISQLIFGDKMEVLERNGEWTFVRGFFDAYEGWVQHRQITPADDALGNDAACVTRKPVLLQREGEFEKFFIPAGCSLPEKNEGKMSIGDTTFMLADDIDTAGFENFAAEISSLSRSFLHAPYQWGGRTHFGIDCSGFAQIVYKMMGVALPRDAWQQAGDGAVVNFLQEVQTGDLAFFDNEEGRITHVGIMLDNETIIHASASVRIDRMDNQGIFAADLKAYSHKLRIIKRIHLINPS